jgi:hypothetical protein
MMTTGMGTLNMRLTIANLAELEDEAEGAVTVASDNDDDTL